MGVDVVVLLCCKVLLFTALFKVLESTHEECHPKMG